MNVEDPDLGSRLAAEFVLGTLQGQAAARFERLLSTTPALQQAVRDWEERLMPLAFALPPRDPPASAWRGIVRRIPALRHGHGRWWDRLAIWRAVAIASFAGLGTLTVVHNTAHDRLAPSIVAAVLTDDRGAPGLVVAGHLDGHELTLRVIERPTLGSDEYLELWAMPVSGAPTPLGALPADEQGRLHLHDGAETLRGVSTLAVSVERRGRLGAAPVGAIVFRGALLEVR